MISNVVGNKEADGENGENNDTSNDAPGQAYVDLSQNVANLHHKGEMFIRFKCSPLFVWTIHDELNNMKIGMTSSGDRTGTELQTFM